MKEQVQFRGFDKVTGYSYSYDPETGVLKIGCQEHTITEWRWDGEDIIDSWLPNVKDCGHDDCEICKERPAQIAHARAELPKLLDAIEASERVTPDLIQYNTSRPETILKADVYDTLELSALAFGGIGARTYFEDLEDYTFDAPRCALGHAYWTADSAASLGDESVVLPLLAAFEWPNNELRSEWGVRVNDPAVFAINARKGKGKDNADRVTFYEWAGELNVRRG